MICLAAVHGTVRMRANSLKDFFPERYAARLGSAKGLPEVLELVRDAVHEREGVSRSGLMLGLAELGGSADRMLCGLYPLNSNIILLNRAALRRVQSTRPDLLRPFMFHVLLHEYLHTLGLAGEGETRRKVLDISRPLFGEEHPVTQMAVDIARFLPFIAYPTRMPLPEGTSIELVEGVGGSSATYFA